MTVSPLVDDGAAYSAIRGMELYIVSNKLFHPSSIMSQSVEFARYDSRQYGFGAHVSSKKAIIGSVELFIRTYSGDSISVRCLVIQESFGWAVGRNLTRFCDIPHIGRNTLIIPSGDTLFSIVDQYHS